MNNIKPKTELNSNFSYVDVIEDRVGKKIVYTFKLYCGEQEINKSVILKNKGKKQILQQAMNAWLQEEINEIHQKWNLFGDEDEETGTSKSLCVSCGEQIISPGFETKFEKKIQLLFIEE